MDDIQEANPAVFELLADIAAGKDAIITSSPDTVVQGFRGARPDLVAELPRLLAPAGGTVLERPLWIAHRHAPAVAEAWLSVAGRISLRAGGQSARRLEQPRTEGARRKPRRPARADAAGSVEAHLLPSPVHELRYVAQRILEAQLNDGRELGDIAVIVRNGGQLSQLQRYLAGQGIPVRIPVAESAVRDEVAVRPLLDAYAVALDPAVLTPESAVSLLTSRIGGATVDRAAAAAPVAAPGGAPGRRRPHQRRPAGGGPAGTRRAGHAGHRGAVRAAGRADDPGRPGSRRRRPAATPKRCCGRSGTPPASPPAGPTPPWPADRPGPAPTATSTP